MQIISVIPFHSEDAAKAERLCDLIFWLSQRERSGHALLVAAPDVHAELKMKVRLSAETAFESVDLLEVKSVPTQSKTAKINKMFLESARHVSQSYRWPWLFLEPDCVPLSSTWRFDLLSAYSNQPKPYMGPHMKAGTGDNEIVFMSRVAIYPPDAFGQLESFCIGPGPFERVSAKATIPRSYKTRIIQQGVFRSSEAEMTPLREDAILFHGDKSGTLVEKVIEVASTKIDLPDKPRRRRRSAANVIA